MTNEVRDMMSDFIKTQPTKSVRDFIGTALVQLFNSQTEQERNLSVTKEHNGRGFASYDAESGTAAAKYFLKTGILTPKQLAQWSVKCKNGFPKICKYHNQFDWQTLMEKFSNKSVVDTETLREEYKNIRRSVCMSSNNTADRFDSEVKNIIGTNISPEDWLYGAYIVKVPCQICRETGKRHGEFCPRCHGKGCQNFSDSLRNKNEHRF